MSNTILTANLTSIPKVYQGKVREVYDLGQQFLIVATDRVSAFDVIMAEGIPNKGKTLTKLSNFWFERFKNKLPNHLLKQSDVINQLKQKELETIQDRYQIVKKLAPLKIEAVVRGYIFGSGWKEYQTKLSVSGISLPKGLKFAQKLDEPIFSPSTKADLGSHDQNISFEQVKKIIGENYAKRVKQIALEIYVEAADYALSKGIIIADTKFEFGIDKNGELYLIDEILTPDSSRFWRQEQYENSFAKQLSPPSFDKQNIRDYLLATNWNQKPPPPKLSAEIIKKTSSVYQEVQDKLLGSKTL